MSRPSRCVRAIAWIAVLAVLAATSAGRTRSQEEHSRGGRSRAAVEAAVGNAHAAFVAWHTANPTATVAPPLTRGLDVAPDLPSPWHRRVVERPHCRGAADSYRAFADRRQSLVGVVELRL